MIAENIARKYGLNKKDVESALVKINSKQVFLYAMSGKMGAGKDTIGNMISNELKKKKYDVVNMSYSTPIKKEMSELISFFHNVDSISKTAQNFNAEEKDVLTFLNLINGKSIYERSPEARLAIQFWGTDVRRKQDPDYWVKKLTELTVNGINNDKCVYISDVRFPNEANSVYDLNGKVIRLTASAETRIERIMKRDSLRPSIEQLTHKSETGLDDYNFEKLFNGNDTPELLVKESLKYIVS